MNVVQREKLVSQQSKSKHELVRKDLSIGIRGSLIPTYNYNSNVSRSTVPRYRFNEPAIPIATKTATMAKRSAMGPPLLEPPRSAKQRIVNSNSTKPESSSSGPARPRVLASDSAAADTSRDLCTPRNRPSVLRYISSSSRGPHSRSARSSSATALEASVILAISEGRGMARGEIGIAAIDLRHPHLVLCQFSDTLLYTHTLTKINYFNPVEIIVPHTFCEGVQPSQLYQQIRDHYPVINLTTVQRRHFNDAAGRQQIQTLCAPQYNAVYLQALHKFYAVTATAAVLKYVEYIQCVVFARESLKIEYHSSDNTMTIDVGTATQLELVQPLVPSAGHTCCLLGVLGPTYTVSGIRALRAAILQPSCNKEFIENRLDAVHDLIENDSGLMTDLQDIIKKLPDVDKILFLCVETPNQNMDKIGEAQLNQTLLLKTTMDMVPKLVDALKAAGSGKLMRIKIDFENPHYNEIAERIRNIIQEDAHLVKGAMGSLQRCFAVKPDINGLLDVARRTYSELIEDIQKIVEQLSETHDLPVRLNQNTMKGFHIVLPIAPKNRRNFNVDELPPIFIQVHSTGASVSMTTEELVVLDQQAKESLNEIQKMSNIVISGLLKELRPFMSSLYKLCENVAELDILLALAQASTIGSYVRPEFNDYLDIRNSVHPLLDYNSQVMPVSNDIFASPEHNFTIITGPNMGGKSIYIKQIALMQIMAQLGCFLPATNAVLRLCDRIFSRIGFNDSVELNVSTYVYEMKEMQHILQGVTKTSLVIIDELCRGTCTEEGTSMAWAICEELIMSDAFTFFTTHFTYLTRLQELYFNVVNRHTVVTEENIENTQNSQKRLVYQHKIEPGATTIQRYGLALAATTNLPEATVNLAKELADIILETRKPQEIRTPQKNDERALYKLNAEIRQESRKNSSEQRIKQILSKFKEDNPQLIERLRVQRSRSNNRTDTSGICPSAANSRGLSSHIIGRSVGTNEYQTHNKPQNLRLRIFNNSTDTDPNDSTHREGANVMDSRQDSSVDRVLSGETPMNYRRHKPYLPTTVVSSTSEADIENLNENNENHAIVKYSTELLNTVIIDNDASIIEQSENNSIKTPNQQENNSANVNFVHNISKNETVSDMNCNSSNFNDSNDLNALNIDNEEPMDIDVEDNDVESASDNSDLAEALTQLMEELSGQQVSSGNSKLSTDEELAKETVHEIYEDLMSGKINLDNVILTPPQGFRD